MEISSVGLNGINAYNNKNISNLLNSKDLSKDASDEKLRKASNSFESFFIQQLLEISMKNLNIAGEETGSGIIKGMYIETMAKASAGSMGIGDMIYEYLKEQQQGVMSTQDLKKIDEASKEKTSTTISNNEELNKI